MSTLKLESFPFGGESDSEKNHASLGNGIFVSAIDLSTIVNISTFRCLTVWVETNNGKKERVKDNDWMSAAQGDNRNQTPFSLYQENTLFSTSHWNEILLSTQNRFFLLQHYSEDMW